MADIHHQFIVKADTRKIFETFTSPNGLNAWWTLEAEGKPALGAEYRFYFGTSYDWRAKVIHLLENRELTWQMTDAMDDWMPTQVGFSLEELDGSTIVRFFHTNWSEENDHFAITTFCWGQLLQGLKHFCETSTIIPFEKRNEP